MKTLWESPNLHIFLNVGVWPSLLCGRGRWVHDIWNDNGIMVIFIHNMVIQKISSFSNLTILSILTRRFSCWNDIFFYWFNWLRWLFLPTWSNVTFSQIGPKKKRIHLVKNKSLQSNNTCVNFDSSSLQHYVRCTFVSYIINVPQKHYIF